MLTTSPRRTLQLACIAATLAATAAFATPATPPPGLPALPAAVAEANATQLAKVYAIAAASPAVAAAIASAKPGLPAGPLVWAQPPAPPTTCATGAPGNAATDGPAPQVVATAFSTKVTLLDRIHAGIPFAQWTDAAAKTWTFVTSPTLPSAPATKGKPLPANQVPVSTVPGQTFGPIGK